MKIDTELYQDSLKRLPDAGQRILAHQKDDLIVVYQAYKHGIADFAVANQYLGGPDFSYSRMSWIKPGFLWMMYRCGWAEKENQERVLALWIQKSDFENILEQAVLSSFNSLYHESHEQWKSDLATKEVRLQWDPDHNPYGNKLQRRAIQIGLKGEALAGFGKKQIRLIEDVTGFVKEQKVLLDDGHINHLAIPVETVFDSKNQQLKDKIGVE
ncbi:DUF4291 domain-containing protein [Mucilaginibacter sp. HC2]|uniref:DUF4291 domain-containing protein n=1 Tax=Mucilaginibacter inviolabilis TaxID=2714892 RepID=UPI00140AAD04|nr:DUF4291 domain-containing protein [Mucilaginibacter inviolabilis]NHA05948.1 DUF4291 domain-containing protein [Mucilaginibacter inviolabilis]